MADTSVHLVARWQTGDQLAADELFGRFANRLIGLARRQLSRQLLPRFDPEDVVQSVYRTFFVDSRAGRFEVQRGGDLWRLLVAITLHKVQYQVRRHTCPKRSVRREDSGDGGADVGHAASYALDPSPVEALILTEQVDRLMRPLPPLHRQMLELRLQGYKLEEIARRTGRTQRTVRRTLDLVRERFETSLAREADE